MVTGNRMNMRIMKVAVVTATATFFGCSDDSSSSIPTCDEFPLPQILPSERPVCLSFDPTPVGSVVTRAVQLQNLGQDTLQISDVRLEDDGRGYFALQGVDQTSLTCEESALVGVVYDPQAAGWDSATLVISSNAENFPTLRIFFLALAVPADDPDFDPGPKPPEAVGQDGSETCPTLEVLSAGTWAGRGPYTASGSAELQQSLDRFIIAFGDDFQVSDVPDSAVVLSTRDSLAGGLDANLGDIVVAELADTAGAQAYDVNAPVVTGFDYVWVFSTTMNVEVARAELVAP